MDAAQRIVELQKGRTGSSDEREIKEIFLRHQGAELTALKNTVDRGEDHRDLLQLLFSDIDDAEIREEILSHFAAEAIRAPAGEAKILSDIDDTFYANWKDERFPKKTIYPGVLQFYRELDLGPTEDGRTGDLAFVTARPRDRPGLIERSTHKSLRERGLDAAIVLSGSFRNLLSNKSIADKKFQNFERYVQLFPEYTFVFIGDSGQGDAIFGQRMLEAQPDRVRGVFIHDVVGTEPSARQPGVSFFETYVAAAHMACERGLISTAGATRVLAAARLDLNAVAFTSDVQRQSRQAELERAAAMLGELATPDHQAD